jgi:hypothetical protein
MTRAHYLIFNENGDIEGAGFGIPPEGAVIADHALAPDQLAAMYVDGANGLALRPRTPPPVVEGRQVTIPAPPLGTVVRVIDAQMAEVMLDTTTEAEGDVVISLADAGDYEISAEAPWPFLPSIFRGVLA